jgi:hypothetical protein
VRGISVDSASIVFYRGFVVAALATNSSEIVEGISVTRIEAQRSSMIRLGFVELRAI